MEGFAVAESACRGAGAVHIFNRVMMANVTAAANVITTKQASRL